MFYVVYLNDDKHCRVSFDELRVMVDRLNKPDNIVNAFSEKYRVHVDHKNHVLTFSNQTDLNWFLLQLGK